MDRKRELLLRVYMVLAVFCLFAALIVYRVVRINLVEGDKWRTKNDVYVQWKPIDTDRGNIYAQDGSLLATSLPFYDVYMDMTRPPKHVFSAQVDSLAYYLAKYSGRDLSHAEWKNNLQKEYKKKNQYLFIAKGRTLEDMELMNSFPIFRLGRIKGGFIAERYTKRDKPFNGLAGRTIGEDRENADNVGVEGAFDAFLKGPTEQRLMKKVPPGIWVPVYDPTESKPQRGNDIVTTIDINMQDVLHSELIKAIQKYEAEGGVAILMEVETGAIRAISNIAVNKQGYYGEFYNHAIGTASEPGSTFKLASTLALLDEGAADLNTIVDVNYGHKTFSGLTMHDSHSHPTKFMDLRSAFEQSSNVGIASAVNDHFNTPAGHRLFIDKLTQFGLKDLTGIELKGEPLPLIKDPEKDESKWYGTTIPWMAHGYELQLTPLQLLNFYNAVANDGTMMKPYLVSRIEDNGVLLKQFEPRVLKSNIAKPQTIAMAKELLRGVVQRGTAKNLETANFTFAGKTGTTRVEYWKEGAKQYNASFAGYFPAEQPKYSMIVTIYKPSGAYYGSTVAAPVFKEIAEKCFALDLKKGF